VIRLGYRTRLAAGHAIVLAVTLGLSVVAVRVNDYEFRSPRAVETCGTYGVESVSLAAVRH